MNCSKKSQSDKYRKREMERAGEPVAGLSLAIPSLAGFPHCYLPLIGYSCWYALAMLCYHLIHHLF